MLIRRILCVLVMSSYATAQSPVRLHEGPSSGLTYSIQCEMQGTGNLTVPGEKGKTTTINVAGRSSIAYEEKLLAPLADGTTRSLRQYRQAKLARMINNVAQETSIRPSVSRMVILRTGTREVPFSPDGPLTFGEVDLVRTDVFTPALAGLLPPQPVKVGDTWLAALSAIEEITDFERVEQGGLECRLVSADGRVATISMNGTVSGVNEDGPVRQQLDGQMTFDQQANLITSFSLTPVKWFLNREGTPTGKIEGKFSLKRQIGNEVRELSESALAGLPLEPNPTNTLLLYEGAVSNIRFTYPRRWRVSVEQGRQITLDGPAGNGLFLTVEPAEKVPAAAAFAAESKNYIEKQQGRVIKTDTPTRLRPFPLEIDRFWMDVEVNKQPARMEYAVIRQRAGGATVAARLTPNDAATLLPEIEQLVKSMQIGPAMPVGVVPVPGK